MVGFNRRLRRALATVAVTLLAPLAYSAEVVTGYWSDVSENEPVVQTSLSPKSSPNPSESRLLKFNLAQLRDALSGAAATNIMLPDPYGGAVEFALRPSSVMPKQLATRYPEIRAFEGVALHDSATTIRLELSSKGLTAQVLGAGNRWLIDPVKGLSPEFARSYKYSKSFHTKDEAFCELESTGVFGGGSAPNNRFKGTTRRAKSTGESVKTYRLAVATTGEYGVYHGGTTASALEAVVATINRVDGIFASELAIRFQLVDDNDAVVFADPATDPFTGNDDAGTLIDESQAQIDLLIGTENYDVGHTLSTGAGGLAGLGVVCREGGKAEGVTGSSRPEGDFFDVDYVAHELGHQFAADHTWNGSNGGCGPQQRGPDSAYEPGSGSSIMSYAGLCGADNIASAVDALFHHQSFDQIIGYTTEGIGSVCGSDAVSGNTAPQVDAGSDYVVPKQTPLVVSGSATDQEQGSLLYSWEQRDLGPQAALTDPDDGRFALFRMLDSSSSPERYLPALATVVSGTPDLSERIPQVAREMTMRLTVKDGAGGVQSDDIVVSIDGDSGPFEVVSPNGGEQVGRSKTVEWDTGFTEQAPVSASMVEIYLSTNDGVSFDQLIDTVDNTGSANINFPVGIQSQDARLMIKGAGNIFYDVSDAAFQLDSDRAVPPTPVLDRVEAGDTKLTLYFDEGQPNGVVADTYEAYCATESIATETDYTIDALLPFDENTPVTSELEITDDFTIEQDGIQVPVNITHTWRGDVVVDLSSPAGTTVRLKETVGTDGDDDVIETYPITALPAESLSAFEGQSTLGTWVLDVSDTQLEDSGQLESWGVTIVSRSSASEGTASGASSPLVVEGLINGETYDCRVTPFAEGWPGESVSFPPAIPVGADGNSLTPTFAALTSTADGFTVQVSNYDAEFTWDVATTAGSASINGTGLIAVTGLGAGQSATITVTASRAGFNDGSAEVTGSANVGAALTPEFGAVSSTSDGFTVQVSNYDAVYVWEVSASAGNAAINGSGLITVSDLTPSQSATVNVTASRTGYESGAAEISGTASVGVALTPEFDGVVSTADGFTVQVSNYDAGFTWDVTPTAGTATISSSGLITVVGLTSGQSSVLTVSTTRSGYESGGADISGSANDTGSSLNITFAVTELSSTTFDEGDGDTVVLAFTVQADAADAQINGLTLAATGDLNDANEVGAVKVFADTNGDGVADTSELVAEGIYTTDNGSVTFDFNEALPITTEASQVLITYEL
ncbi:MAG: M12 family metallo-peptidase [Luminiphilus sp.]|nr:M12 family metallo-peptidase [Luminiphilus sp.]